MIWFVRINGRFIGTVVAATEGDALCFAQQKFHLGWEDQPVEVSPRLRPAARLEGR